MISGQADGQTMRQCRVAAPGEPEATYTRRSPAEMDSTGLPLTVRWRLLLHRSRRSGALTTWPGRALPGRTDAGCTEILLRPSGAHRGRPGSLVRGRRITVALLRRVVFVRCIGQLADGVDARVDVSFDDGAGFGRGLFGVHINVTHIQRLTAVQHTRLERSCTHRVRPFRRSRSIRGGVPDGASYTFTRGKWFMVLDWGVLHRHTVRMVPAVAGSLRWAKKGGDGHCRSPMSAVFSVGAAARMRRGSRSATSATR